MLLRHYYFFLCLIAVSALPAIASLTQLPCMHEYCEKQNTIFEWVKANGGYVNPNVQITVGPDPNWNIRGIFATAPIKRTETIFQIPRNLSLCRAEFCGLVAALSHEISRGKASFWWPYLSVLEDHEVDLPYTWTVEERDLLRGLHPRDLSTLTTHELCIMLDMDDETIIRASQLVFARNVGHHCMVPLFDSLSHDHREQINTEYEELDGRGFLVYAHEDISEKKQLFITYGDDSFNYLFRDYGFFLQYPRLWVFEDEETGEQVKFKIYEREHGYDFDFNPENVSHQKNIFHMYQVINNHLTSVLANEPKGFTNNSSTTSSKRFDTALAFRKEYVNAFQIASDRLYRLVEDQKKARVACFHDYCEKQSAIFEWVEDNGGYVNPSIQITVGPDPNWNTRGVFATSSILNDDTIFLLPSNLLLCRLDFCDLVSALSYELSLGNSSFWWPYISLLMDQELDLPYIWSKEERGLLSGLYPRDLEESAAHEMCHMLDMNNETNIQAFQLVISRAGDGGLGGEDYTCMIPLYDSINHAQESYQNSAFKGHFENYLEVFAVGSISENKQLLDSFTDSSYYFLFQNFGFLSQYPRLWVFEDENNNQKISFKISEMKDGSFDFDFNPELMPHQDDLAYMYEAISSHLSSILESEPSGIRQKSSTVSDRRYKAALSFRQNYLEAFRLASDHLERLSDEGYEEDHDVKEHLMEEETLKKNEQEEIEQLTDEGYQEDYDEEEGLVEDETPEENELEEIEHFSDEGYQEDYDEEEGLVEDETPEENELEEIEQLTDEGYQEDYDEDEDLVEEETFEENEQEEMEQLIYEGYEEEEDVVEEEALEENEQEEVDEVLKDEL
jgi:hypothetical protein